ncbi:MAG TPA: methylated-DNA--[protein]-cysteine S-methyltransferase [Gammaproteobacteria bacterium]|nr:methylated-DNA--[protein]-cysteine S-methyltransferase [Gammaproteobacteria bacterium]
MQVLLNSPRLKLQREAYSAIIASPVGPLGLKVEQGKLKALDFLSPNTPLILNADSTVDSYIRALHNYFSNSKLISIPLTSLSLSGTPFQLKVWDALTKIPAGSTITYGHLAKALNSSPRAIGGACKSNPCPIIIPCHRVVAAKHLGGFAGCLTGSKIKLKHWLLQHEASFIKNCI